MRRGRVLASTGGSSGARSGPVTVTLAPGSPLAHWDVQDAQRMLDGGYPAVTVERRTRYQVVGAKDGYGGKVVEKLAKPPGVTEKRVTDPAVIDAIVNGAKRPPKPVKRPKVVVKDKPVTMLAEEKPAAEPAPRRTKEVGLYKAVREWAAETGRKDVPPAGRIATAIVDEYRAWANGEVTRTLEEPKPKRRRKDVLPEGTPRVNGHHTAEGVKRLAEAAKKKAESVDYDPRVVRQWARDHDIEVPASGRFLPKDVVVKFQEAHA